MDVRSSIRPKIRLALCCAIAAATLLILHACIHQTSFRFYAVSGEYYTVDVDSPGAFGPADLARFLEALNSSRVQNIQTSKLGKWAVRKGLNMRGRLEGRKVLLKLRRRPNMQSEMYSYYLNCYLDMWNAPPTALRCVNKDGEFTTDTAENTCYIISAYVEGLSDEVYIPEELRLGIDKEAISTTPRELSRLMEWSDVILFDFLTGHSDRLLDNLYIPHVNLEVPMKQVPNIAKISSGELVLIDHEATFHGSYLKAQTSSAERKRQSHFLGRVYVFRRHTVERICSLCSQEDPVSTLEQYMEEYDWASLRVSSQLCQSDRESFRERLSTVCGRTCHLLSGRTHR